MGPGPRSSPLQRYSSDAESPPFSPPLDDDDEDSADQVFSDAEETPSPGDEADGPLQDTSGALDLKGDEIDVNAWALNILENHQRDLAQAADANEDTTGSDSTTLVDSEDIGHIDEDFERKVFVNGPIESHDVDPADGLQRVANEFGPWSGDGTEEFVEMLPASLYRSVLIKGTMALTTKRLVYLAYLPRLEPGKVLKTGAMNVHVKCKGRFYGSNSKTFRRWAELRTDTFIGYSNSTNVYKPKSSFSLAEIRSLDPLDPKRPKNIRVHFINGNTAEMALDTEEAADAWHKELVAALWSFRTRTDTLRVAIPLARIANMETSVLEGIARVMRINIDMVGCPMSCGHDIIEGEEMAETEIYFGYLLNHDPMYERVQSHIDMAKVDIQRNGSGRRLPEPLLDIHGMRKKDCEQKRSTADAEAVNPAQEDVDLPEMAKRFNKVFALDTDPKDLYVTRCQLIRTLPLYGTVAVGPRWLCFWRHNVFSADVKLRIPMSDVEGAHSTRAFGFHVWGLAVQLTGAPDVRFDFHSRTDREATLNAIRDAVAAIKPPSQTSSLEKKESRASTVPPLAPAEEDRLSEMTRTPSEDEAAKEEEAKRSRPLGLNIFEPVKFAPGARLPHKILAVGMKRKIMMPQKFTLLTIGSRGDVQVYISLGQRLLADGHSVTIASHPEYRSWVESFGIAYKDVGGDPAALMKLAVEHPVLSTGFFKESIGHFRKWLDDLFMESWEACQGTDVLIESPSTFAGIHIAEKLQIPYFRAFTMPWTRTASYPQAMAAGNDIGPSYNLMSYTLFDNLIWTAMSGQVNRWRRKVLGLPATTFEKLHGNQTPFIYNFSSAVVPRPNDWKDHIFISGYWFLDSPSTYKPPKALVEFIERAKNDDVPIGYVGFGSITVPDAGAMTKAIYAAVKAAGIRAVVCKGWSERGSTKPAEEILAPPEVLALDSIPHDWLFPQIDFACHHGGAGTTAASLRYGLPTLIHPFFGDQTFWTSRVGKLGAGMRVDSLSESDFTTAFRKATTDRIMKEKAEKIGQKIRSEDGPAAALEFISDHMALAKQRVIERAERTAASPPKLTKSASLMGPRRSSSTPTDVHLPGSPLAFPRFAPSRSSTLASTYPSATYEPVPSSIPVGESPRQTSPLTFAKEGASPIALQSPRTNTVHTV